MPDPYALYPTKTRLALLVDVGAGLVRRIGHTDYRGGLPSPQRVTARISELRQAGWIEPGPDGIYALTEAGQDVIAETVR